jgi:hypothetical protein
MRSREAYLLDLEAWTFLESGGRGFGGFGFGDWCVLHFDVGHGWYW